MLFQVLKTVFESQYFLYRVGTLLQPKIPERFAVCCSEQLT